ncbi:MAG: M20/M25/M40 family metallo-hydrolase [Blastocatellia bacterium]|nr:M20/M25/M40 family metallo-hydrolase [Blastocatellia bacterium]
MKPRTHFLTAILFLSLVCSGLPVGAQQAQPAAPPKNANDPIERIKDEGMNRSQVMKTLSYLTDVIGPRLTGSPGLKRANEWTRDTLKGWGLENAHLEAWGPFGRGWTLKSFSAEIVAPQAIPLIAFPKAWSNGTGGPLTAEIVYVEAKEEKELEKYKGALKGKIVLSAPIREMKARFEAPGTRMTEKELLQLADAQDPAKDRAGGPMAMMNNPQAMEFIKTAVFDAKKAKFFLDEGAAAVLAPSRSGDGGTIFLEDAGVPREVKGNSPMEQMMNLFMSRMNPWDKENHPNLPQVTIAIEQSNRLIRMIQAGEKLTARINLDVQFHAEDLMAYNTIAEIPGTDKKDEIVMVGAHIDSWHSGTGATDNGAGCAAAMEAVRILKALNLQPRRTIRIGLWSGEEQGLFGSRAYVKEHLGARGDAGSPQAEMAAMMGGGSAAKIVPKPAYEKFSAYFNLDNGTGRIRGVYLQGNEAVRPIFRDWLMPFREQGATTLTISNTGGTDHLSFDAIGLPGFQFIQDEIEYDTRTHHSNMDVFDRIQAGDMKQAATIMAAFLYNAAMRDEKLPRKPAAVK